MIVFIPENKLELEKKYLNIHQKLIDKCRKGDSKAQFEIYKLYYKAMYNTGLRILNNEPEAEDIMQDAFLSAFKKIDSYKGEVSFGAWLKKIVVNKSLDALKSKKADFEDLDTIQVDISDDEPDHSIDEQKVKIEEVKKAINELPDGYRITLSLYLFEGYDHEEIGEIMNISSSTSRSQFTRAKRKLIEQLKKETCQA